MKQNFQVEQKFQHHLFFTPIYGFKLNLSEDYLNNLIAESYSMYEKTGINTIKSTRNGFQSEGNLINIDLFQGLFTSVLQAFEVICQDYSINLERKKEFQINRAWVNVNPKGGYNLVHNHPNAFYSGVYYLQTAEKCGGIVFKDPVLARTLNLPFPTIKRRNNYTFDNYCFKAISDHVLFFPSYLEHYVEPNESELERICIAFNISFREEIK